MEAVVIILGVIAFFLFCAAVFNLAEENWSALIITAALLFVVVGALFPLSAIMLERHGERLTQERAVCESAGWLWAHNEEACINEQGWTVDVR